MMRHISICICTFKRPHLLERLLTSINDLRSDGDFDYSVTVVDNDGLGSAKDVAVRAKAANRYEIDYFVEPERNISLARNRSVLASKGDLIAFIDDDEFPDDNWLLSLYRTLNLSGFDGVLGPVIPHFDSPPPSWLSKSGLLCRTRFPTNSQIVDSRYLRTGNILLWKRLFLSDEVGFDPRYGKTGGSDAVFLKKKIKEGKRFIWCDEACVYETVLPERQRLFYYIKRAFTRGMTTAWNTPFWSISTLRSLLVIPVYTISLPFCACLGKHIFANILIKDCDHAAKMLAYAGIRLFQERPY